jgi:hypothetical protein
MRQGEVGLGHQFGGIYYHAFSEGSCYEVGEGIATSGYGAVDGMEKVDERHVFAILDKIIQSVTIHAPKTVVAASPSIRFLALSPLRQRSPSAYCVSWDVQGAEQNQVWLSATCSGDLSIFEVTGNTPEDRVFPCDILTPAKSATGSLNLEFRKMAGGRIKEALRLFAAGRPSVSRTVTIDLPSLPVIISFVSDGKKYVSPFSGTPLQVVAGHNVQIGGVGFLPHQDLWIGSTSLRVQSSDTQSINFEVPKSLREGQYSLMIENEHGKSNALAVQVVK